MQTLNEQIAVLLPHLERYARTLTRNADDAQDLVQDCVERALIKSYLFSPDTNLRAWMFTIMRNLFINGVRRQRIARSYAETVGRDDSFSLQLPRQADALMLSETMEAIRRLSLIEREAVMVLGLEQRTHREVSIRTQVPIGTLKSRLSRARAKLRAVLDGAEGELPRAA